MIGLLLTVGGFLGLIALVGWLSEAAAASYNDQLKRGSGEDQ